MCGGVALCYVDLFVWLVELVMALLWCSVYHFKLRVCCGQCCVGVVCC